MSTILKASSFFLAAALSHSAAAQSQPEDPYLHAHDTPLKVRAAAARVEVATLQSSDIKTLSRHLSRVARKNFDCATAGESIRCTDQAGPSSAGRIMIVLRTPQKAPE